MRSGRWHGFSTRRSLLCAAAAGLLAPAGRARGAEGAASAPERLNLLFLGDSLAQGLFLSLSPVLRRRPTPRLINGTLHATGVTRTDEHDWSSVTRDLVALHEPQLVVFWIGANDFRPLVVREERVRHRFGTPGYAEHYARRVVEMTGHAVHAGARVLWLGLPNMREPQFAGAARQLNAIQQAAAASAGAQWVDTWDATSDADGRYLPSVPVQTATRVFRAEDGVHFTGWGYLRIGALLFDTAAERFPELAPGLGRLTEA
ncbi:DUF459 domain-containing protein [Falsiroseomonas sp.]|uniref:DUF459 domain-containing protein n=1 Tax=Falsiroseomonas sp. TaxID=2870721 RepID=UPI003F70A2E3